MWRPIEEALQVAEVRAVATTTPTPDIDAFLAACSSAGRSVAIVSNNCEASVRIHVEQAGLARHIRHSEARDPVHVERMKPSQHLVDRAADALKADIAECVLIGDQVSEVAAAIAAGARSIGYANKPGKVADLATACARAIMDDTNVLAAAWEIASQAVR